MNPAIAVLGSLDTKEEETAFLAEAVRQAGGRAVVIDTSAGGSVPALPWSPDISVEEVAAAAGTTVAELGAMDRAPAMRLMASGASAHVSRLAEGGACHGVVGAGGSNAAVVFAQAAQGLPFGFPKFVVTTMATVDASAVIGDSDVTLMYPVADIDGLNSLTTSVLEQAAAAVVAMARVRHADSPEPRRRDHPVVAATMFGVTTTCVQAVRTALEAEGDEVIVFHATGTGGRSMESLADGGAFEAIVDVTTTELADLVAGGELSAGPDRLVPARGPNVPRVVVPGAVDMANFGASDTVPQHLRDRVFHVHNDNVTLMRTTADENRQIGQLIGAFVAARDDAVAVLPLGGVSALDVEDGPFWDPDADDALFEAIRRAAPGRVTEVDAHINDATFAARVVAELDDLRPRDEMA